MKNNENKVTIMKNILLALSAAAVFLTGACASFSEPEYFNKDSGTIAELKVDDVFRITLDGNPTTGYLWVFAAPYNEEVVILCGDKYEKPDEKLVGAPVKRTLTFKVVGPGKTGIKLEYRRPWEKKQKPEGTFELMVSATGEARENPFVKKKDETPRVGSKGQVEPPPKHVLE